MIDLHMHTNLSGNQLETVNILKVAKIKGINHLSFTDHYSIEGINESIKMGLELGIDVIPGIEISAFDYKKKKNVHILGYYINSENLALKAFCREMVIKHNQAYGKIVKNIARNGFDIKWDDVIKYTRAGGTIYESHIMHALVDKGYSKKLYGNLYKELFFKKRKQIFAQADNNLELPNVDFAIKMIRNAGGVAVLAHPGRYDNFDSISDMVSAGLEGIEIFHPEHGIKEIEKSLEYVEKFKLVITGGSNYHGIYSNVSTSLGCSQLCDVTLFELMSRRKVNTDSFITSYDATDKTLVYNSLSNL